MVQVQDAVAKGRLLHRLDELVRRHEVLSERVALFENTLNRQQLDELTSQIEAAQQQLNEAAPVLS